VEYNTIASVVKDGTYEPKGALLLSNAVTLVSTIWPVKPLECSLHVFVSEPAPDGA
jgi:hypothetical protein